MSRRWVVAVSAAILVLAAVAHATSIATAQSPSPQELWNAYPLKPGSARSEPTDPAPTPTAAPRRAAGDSAAEADAGESNVTPAILIGFATLAFCVGFAMMAFRLRDRVEVLEPPAAAPPVELRERRFAPSQPWPDAAAEGWTCEVEFKSGYRKSTFRAMAAAPGESRRTRRIAESEPIKWMLMGAPEPPTPETAEAVRGLTAALTDHGWEQIGSGDRWYAQRFVWRQEDEPRPIAPQTGRAVDA